MSSVTITSLVTYLPIHICHVYDVYNVHVMYIVHLLYVVHLNHIMMKCVAYPYLIIKYHLINNYLIKRSNIGCSNC
jgi:hypothetical protein